MKRTLRCMTKRGRTCARELKWRNRRRQGIGGLLRSVHDLNGNVYDAADELINIRRKVRRTRAKQEEVQAELNKLKCQLTKKKNNLQKATDELHKAVRDLQKPNNLHDLNEEENSVLKIDLWMAEEDIVEAWNHIHDAEDDLNYEVIRKFQDTMLKNLIKETPEQEPPNNIEEGIRNINAVKLSNIASNGVMPMNGTIKVNRNKCCICLEAKIDCVLYKCGHVCTCYSCTTVLMTNPEKKECPVCRTKIKDVIRTYIV